MASLFRFATGVSIEADDNWLGGTEHTHSTPPYRIVGNKEVRAVPLGYIVDRGSSAFIRRRITKAMLPTKVAGSRMRAAVVAR